MTGLKLLRIDSNFQWPGKVQSLVHRIYSTNRDMIGMPINNWSHPRIKDAIQRWTHGLFEHTAGSSIRNYNLNFNEFDRPGIIDADGGFQLNIETAGREMYNISIYMNRPINQCCDVYCHQGNWRINGVNIFQIIYVDQMLGFRTDSPDISQLNGGYLQHAETDMSRLTVSKDEKKDEKAKSEFEELKKKITEMSYIVRKENNFETF